MGAAFHARFFLKQPEPVCLVARERDNRHYYWLDKVSPQQPWDSGFHNEFAWPTAPVIQALGLKLYDLAALVRLDCAKSTPSATAEERIAPVILYQTQAPSVLSGYVFTLALNFWRVPTRVQLDLHAKSLEFTTASDRPSYPLLKSALKFAALEIDGFEQAEFSPKRLSIPGRAAPQPFKEQTFRLFGGQNPRARFALETPAQLAALEIAAGTTLRLAASARQLQLKWQDSAQTLEVLSGNPAPPRAKGKAAKL